jgi:thiamine biosynthesis lipoprotein
MESPRPTSRRHFITGRSAASELHDLTGRAVDDSTSETSLFEAAAGTEPPYLVRYGRQAMASDFQLHLVAGRDDHGPEAALAALDVVDEIETQLTVYRETSEVLDINRRAALEPVPVEPRLFELLRRSLELSRATGGAYDITSGPLSRVWGFTRRQGRVPDEAERTAALDFVGYERVELDDAAQTVRFTQPGVEINLNSIGKGYALDRAAEVLRDFQVHDFLWHGGQSSVLTGGAPQRRADGEPAGAWVVGVGHPLRPERRLAEVVVGDRAVGTSGAGFQFFRHEGKRYGHILDPRTGMPAEGVFSVTVVAPTAAEADALSTAFYVLGCEGAERYCAARPEIGFLMLMPNAGGNAVELAVCNLDDCSWRLTS